MCIIKRVMSFWPYSVILDSIIGVISLLLVLATTGFNKVDRHLAWFPHFLIGAGLVNLTALLVIAGAIIVNLILWVLMIMAGITVLWFLGMVATQAMAQSNRNSSGGHRYGIKR